MRNVVFFIDELNETQHAIISNNDGSTTSMPKSVYDEMIAKQIEVTND
jgi:hypothetical protein